MAVRQCVAGSAWVQRLLRGVRLVCRSNHQLFCVQLYIHATQRAISYVITTAQEVRGVDVQRTVWCGAIKQR